jgi:hypothetical protein
MDEGVTELLELIWRARASFSERKWRLCACGCARTLPDAGRAPLREAVLLVERYADGQATPLELASMRYRTRHVPDCPAALLCWGPGTNNWDVAMRLVNWLLGARGPLFGHELQSAYLDILAEMAGPSVPLAPPSAALISWEGGTLRRLAQGIYAERAWDSMPVLGDALEEAGCTDELILSHCRGTHPHSRGCWAVDWLLGKN